MNTQNKPLIIDWSKPRTKEEISADIAKIFSQINPIKKEILK